MSNLSQILELKDGVAGILKYLSILHFFYIIR